VFDSSPVVRGEGTMRKTIIAVLRHAHGYDANVVGLTFGITNAATPEEAIGRLVTLLSHPLGVTIERETAEGME
jgi:hypothetical protein